MTEKEYINVSDLNRLRQACTILATIIPANSDVIVKEDFQEIMSKLQDWEQELGEDVSENVKN